ncbi:MAG TPA: tail tape measure protein [Novosphingobium sp.]|nr:tail tape measure protein [Novosphingobium sp.]HZV09290.1 tail tape measure protein [Novosphingobium sp.]
MSSSSRYTSSTGSTSQSLTIDVRASTQNFAQDIAAMRSSVDGTLLTGFTQAGSTLDTGLTNALAKGVTGFTNLRTTALGVINDIAAQASSNLFASVGSDTGAVASGGLLGVDLVSSLLTGLPGRATGGAVSPGQAYMVGERGPEVFVPTSAGSIAANGSGAARETRVSINVNAPQGSDGPQALQRSSRQIASAMRRALAGN